MKFALRNKIPNERPAELADRKAFVSEKRDDILNSLGIGHTKKTLVGNEFIRGVSGGERKRVSLAEVLAGQVRTAPSHELSLDWNKLTLLLIRALFKCGTIPLEAWILKLRSNLPVCCAVKRTKMKRR